MSDQEPPLEDSVPAQPSSEGEWQKTSRLGILIKGLAALPQAFIALVAVSFGGGGTIFRDSSAMIAVLGLLGMILVILSVALGYAYFSWSKLRYRIGSSDIRLEQGVFARTARSVPYERIQDVSLEQKLLPRLLGLVAVRFETGAGGKDELALTYVKLEQGEALRESVRARLGGADVCLPIAQHGADGVEHTAALSAASAIAKERAVPLFSMGIRRLVTFGLFEFSLAVLAVLFAAAQQFDFLLPFPIWDFKDWGERLSGPGATLLGLGAKAQIIGAILAVLSLIFVGFAAGIIRTALRDFGFLLEKTPKGFRRRRGLFTRTDVVMPVHRVQAITVNTGIIRRLFGWHGLFFISLAQDTKSSNHSVAPFAKMHEIATIAQAAGLGLPPEDLVWKRSAANFRVDGAISGAIVPIIGAIIAAYFHQLWPVLGLLVLAILISGRAYFLWRYERFALDDTQIYSRQGWLAPKMTIASRVKLHSVEIMQGPIARRRGYADLRFGLAGGKFSFAGLALKDAQKLRKEVLASIVEVDFADLSR